MVECGFQPLPQKMSGVLKHEKSSKTTDPFLVNSLDVTASYAQDEKAVGRRDSNKNLRDILHS